MKRRAEGWKLNETTDEIDFEYCSDVAAFYLRTWH